MDEPARPLAERQGLAETLRHLSDPGSYPGPTAEVEVVETRMSYVFLAGREAYKLKKPVRTEWLDFTTPQARLANCREEVRLNRRLAPGVYLGVVPLVARGGRLALGLTGADAGEPVDWLVRMHRLPRRLMLDHVLLAGPLAPGRLGALAATLASFHESLPPADISPADHLRRFREEHERDARELGRHAGALDQAALSGLLRAAGGFLEREGDLLAARAGEGMVKEGHGDLRPDHVCLTDPPVVIDCLEFSRLLRLVDPYEELACLCLECARLGAGRQCGELLHRYRSLLGREPSARLEDFYAVARALLRARLAASRLDEPGRAPPGHWAGVADLYLGLAREAAARLTGR